MIHWTSDMLKAHQERIGTGAGRIVRPMGPLPTRGTAQKPAKYKSVPTVVDGVKFDSKLEAGIWQQLRLLQAAGEIAGLRRQVRFSLFADGGEHIGIYTADFVYREKGQDGTFKRVVADAKSGHTRTLAAWRRTLKLMLACHGVEVRELP